MQVAILVKEFPPDVIGGTETQTKRMATELSREGHEVTVYTKAYGGDDDSDVPYDVVRLWNWQHSPFVSTLTFLLSALVRLVRDANEVDVLQSMMIYPTGFVGYLLNRTRGVPYFAWIRGGDYYFMKENRVKRWTIRAVLRDTTVLVQTEQIRDDVTDEFEAADVRVLGNGVDLSVDEATGTAVVYVGRLVEQKGVHVLLEAMEEIDAPLLVVGDGPEREALERRSRELDVDAEFVGWVDPASVDTYLRRGALFVLPSVDGEGLPNAILEAYAHGLPVVATDTGGVRDVVVDGRTGFVVEPGSVGELHDRIAEVVRNEDLRDTLSAGAREFVNDHYSWSVIVDELETVYRDCAD